MSDFGGDDGEEGLVWALSLEFIQLNLLYRYDSYNAEPVFEEDEPEFEPQDPDDNEYPTSTAAPTPGPHGTEDPDAQVPNGLTNGATTPGRTVVEVNGENSQQQAKKNAVLGLKEKKIEDDKRTTTPYMTKYERARVLGTRALQIR